MNVNVWRIRRVLLLLCGALVVLAVLLFLSVQISETHNGAVEMLNGRADTTALAAPLGLFLVGACGFIAVSSWRPRNR